MILQSPRLNKSHNTSLNLTRYVGASRLVARRLAWRCAVMKRSSLISAFVGGTIILCSCSAVNTLFDDAEVFVNERNSEVGKPLSKVLKSDKYYQYWEGNQNSPYGKKFEVVPLDTIKPSTTLTGVVVNGH